MKPRCEGCGGTIISRLCSCGKAHPELSNTTMKTTDTPYPPHTPPAAPEGMRWEYRGLGWRVNETKVFYAIHQGDGPTPVKQGHPIHYDTTHYFEAVPITEEETRLAELAEARKKVQEVYEGPLPFSEILTEKTPPHFQLPLKA